MSTNQCDSEKPFPDQPESDAYQKEIVTHSKECESAQKIQVNSERIVKSKKKEVTSVACSVNYVK